ncbi:MAG: hypothetical protein HQM00_13435, partial [Magnetococcales bacterium]|nr:hypothetical protein [Magnetococcales bacterium]
MSLTRTPLLTGKHSRPARRLSLLVAALLIGSGWPMTTLAAPNASEAMRVAKPEPDNKAKEKSSKE